MKNTNDKKDMELTPGLIKAISALEQARQNEPEDYSLDLDGVN